MVDPADLDWFLIYHPGVKLGIGYWVVGDYKAEKRITQGRGCPLVLPPLEIVAVYEDRGEALEAADDLNEVSAMMAS